MHCGGVLEWRLGAGRVRSPKLAKKGRTKYIPQARKTSRSLAHSARRTTTGPVKIVPWSVWRHTVEGADSTENTQKDTASCLHSREVSYTSGNEDSVRNWRTLRHLVASRSVADLRLRCASTAHATAWYCSQLLWPRSHALASRRAARPPRSHVWASVRRSPHSSGAARMQWARPLRGRCQSPPVSSPCASSQACCRR